MPDEVDTLVNFVRKKERKKAHAKLQISKQEYNLSVNMNTKFFTSLAFIFKFIFFLMFVCVCVCVCVCVRCVCVCMLFFEMGGDTQEIDLNADIAHRKFY